MTPRVQVLAMTAPLIIMLLILAWTVAVDSRRRWPGVSWQHRLGRVMTFYREP